MNFSPAALYAWYRRTIRHPKWRWWLVAATLLYLATPVDLIPEFLLPVGFIDDIALAGLMIVELSQLGMDYLKERRGNGEGATSEEATTTVDVDAKA
ncbi:MAG: YkvA family protein [Cyanobacteria bacterium P01_C01_bin.89]|mgnify:CR=1 FL=1